MWWREASRRTLLWGAAMIPAFGLGGCLQPMYGNYAAGGPGVSEELKLIAIDPIPDRFGHYLGDDLIFALNGTGSHPTPKYRLTVTYDESVQTPLIDTVSGRASAGTMVINGNYELKRIDTDTVLTKGTTYVFKSYDRTSDRFSNIRAARDAEIRNAQQLSDELRLRISSYFSTRKS